MHGGVHGDAGRAGRPVSGAGRMRVAVVLEAGLPAGRSANVAAVLSAGAAAAVHGLGGEPLVDARGRRTAGCARVPIPILQAPPQRLRELVARAYPAPDGAALVVFPVLAETVHHYAAYVELVKCRDLGEEPLRGVALAGPETWVRSLTGSLALLR